MEEPVIKKLVGYFNKYTEHPKDVEYFTEFPAPLMSLMHSAHFTNINSTIAFFGPMLYFLTRAFRCEKVLEIGFAQGYSSWYLANAVNDNATRFQYKNSMYYGIDIKDNEPFREVMKLNKLPHNLTLMDSINLTPDTFKDIQFDLIFQDGCHDTEHVMHELATLWPQLKGAGKGYWIFHDCFGPSEEAFNKLIPLLKEENVEWIRLDDDVYGMAILRKMEGYDYNNKHWQGG